MGTHPIFESDFDCLTENMYPRQTSQPSAPPPEGQYNYPAHPPAGSSSMPQTTSNASPYPAASPGNLPYPVNVQAGVPPYPMHVQNPSHNPYPPSPQAPSA